MEDDAFDQDTGRYPLGQPGECPRIHVGRPLDEDERLVLQGAERVLRFLGFRDEQALSWRTRFDHGVPWADLTEAVRSIALSPDEPTWWEAELGYGMP